MLDSSFGCQLEANDALVAFEVQGKLNLLFFLLCLLSSAVEGIKVFACHWGKRLYFLQIVVGTSILNLLKYDFSWLGQGPSESI